MWVAENTHMKQLYLIFEEDDDTLGLFSIAVVARG